MLDLWLYPALTAVAMLAGFVDAIAGGGGLIMVPALIHAGLPPHVVLGTNKVGSSFGTGLAAWRYRKAGLYQIRPNLPLVAFVFAGALLGTLMIQRLDPRVLALVVPLLLIAVALYTLLSRRMDDADSQARIGERGYAPVAASIGFYDGFFGPGTGQFFTATLVGLRGLGLTRATGLTKLLNLTSNFASALAFAAGGQVIWALAACLAAGSMAGAWLGAMSATRLGARLIRPLLIAASLALTTKLVWDWFAG
jgi:uncharacterized protein